ncbi:hypothetical protein EV361DRAFT_928911 [Lentinula raphanica]|nr:hypothetical protein EV361DRAFT_928911 [Lentinula raphanica]
MSWSPLHSHISMHSYFFNNVHRPLSSFSNTKLLTAAMTRSTASRALALLCLGVVISSNVLAVPIQSTHLPLSSNPSLDGAEPLTQSSQLMGQTLDVATPQRQDFGLHRDKDDDLTVDDLEHDLPVAISPSTSISVNLDHQADLSKRGDDKSKIPVREVYERLEADLKSIFTLEDQWSENEKLKDDFHHYHLGKVKLIEDWYPKLGEILDYATKVPQLQVSPDPEPDYIHGIFAEGHLQHKFLNNIAQWNRVSSKKLRTKLEYAAATFELIMGRATLFAMEEEKAEIETIRDRDPVQYHTKCKEFDEEYRPQVEEILKFAQQVKAHPELDGGLQSLAEVIIRHTKQYYLLLGERQPHDVVCSNFLMSPFHSSLPSLFIGYQD